MQSLQHRFRLLQHLLIPETDDRYPLPMKVRGALRIPAFFIGFVVLPAVHLDRQAGLVTVEIQHIRGNRVLAAEFQPAELPVSKQIPEQLLGIGLFLAQLAGERQKTRAEGWPGLFSLTRPAATLSRRERVFHTSRLQGERVFHISLFQGEGGFHASFLRKAKAFHSSLSLWERAGVRVNDFIHHHDNGNRHRLHVTQAQDL